MQETELYQELCDHVLGHVFGIAEGCADGGPLFCQVMGWPEVTTRGLISTLCVYARAVPHDTVKYNRTIYYRIPDGAVQPRPWTPAHSMQCNDWMVCVLKRRIDHGMDLTAYELCFKRGTYIPRSEWLVPGHLFGVTGSYNTVH